MKYDVIIIGAGSAGLMAMKELLETGYRVCLIEAASSAGGRIATIKKKGFYMPVETGAEFIHGKLPLTIKILKQANIDYEAVTGKMIRVLNGKWYQEEEQTKHWDELMRKLRKQKKDVTIRAFLDDHFLNHGYEDLRKAVQGFAEGFDLADITKASVLPLRKEWAQADQTQYRIPGGYSQLTDWLLGNCLALKGKIYFNCFAKTVEYKKGNVAVTTSNSKKFEAAKLIITASIGMLQSGMIEFNPGLGAHQEAIRQIGFGSVTKMQLLFKTPFWKEKTDEIGFLITDESIPTWWTQLPVENNLLTGWLGGPKAGLKANNNDRTLLRNALLSLSSVFHLPHEALTKELFHYKIRRWHNDPFTLGGYSYSTLFSEKAVEILSEPIAESIFFAGEAIYSGESRGTVEAALQSGLDSAKKIRKIR